MQPMTAEENKDEAPAKTARRRVGVEPRQAAVLTWLAQAVLGFCCFLFFLPYLRQIRGLDGLSRGQRRLFLCNHTSLLDTILLGGVFWSRLRLPILVLGDRAVWHRSMVRRFLSSRVGFLIERDGLSKRRIQELQAFGRSCEGFDLFVFPEGTRGDGITVQECQPGAYFVARAAEVPIVPVFIENMAQVSSKQTGFRPFQGLGQVRITFGEEIPTGEYTGLNRAQFSTLIRRKIQALRPVEDDA